MVSLWNVVVVRHPVVLARVLFFGCLSLWINPHVFVEVVDCWLEVLNMCNMCWNVHVVVSGSEVSLALLEAMAVCIGIIVLVIGVLLLHALVVVELVLKQFWVLDEVVVHELVALVGVEGVDHFLLEDEELL